MNYEKFNTDWNKPTIITAQQYGVKVSVELDHSDTDIDELFDAFQTLVVGLGYHESAWKGWIVERAAEYQEEEDSKWDDEETVLHDKVKQSIKDTIAKYNKDSEGYEEQEKLEDEFFGKYDIDETGAYHTDKDWEELYNGGNIIDWDTADDKRMDIIGQNGNEGTHYGLATDEDIEECELNDKGYKGIYVEEPTEEDEDQYDDYGQLIPTNRPHFKWDEDEEEDWFDEVPNEKLREAAKQYSEKVRSNHTPIKEQKVLGKWQTDNRTKEVVKLDKTKVRKGKIKDLKK